MSVFLLDNTGIFPYSTDMPRNKERKCGLLREIRESNKASLNEYAMRIGISVGALSNIERGRRGFSFDTGVKIAEVYDIPVGILRDEFSNELKQSGSKASDAGRQAHA